LNDKLAAFSDTAYAVMRIVIGLLFAFHGMQKLFGVLSQHPMPPVGSQMWIGGVIEFYNH
jgi:putative oxidoreductase